MIKRVIPLAALVFSSSAIAQVGIGTQKPATSAQLDIVATDKGVLLPRVQLNTINDHSVIKGKIEESLLVYHVGTSTLEAGFYYWKSNVWNRLLSGDVVTDRKNNTFTIGANPNQNGEESLIITDTQNAKVYLAVSEIAKNTSFVTELASNNEFATQLGDNTTFIEQVTSNTAFIQNLISELEGTYGTVNYDVEQQVFYYMEGNTRRDIALEDLNTENQSFTLENDHLVVTDSEGSQVRVAVSEIAKNTSFVTELASNNEFATQLGDNTTFIEQVTSNTAFIQNLISELEGTYGTVNYDVEQQVFYYMEGNTRRDITLEDLNTENQSFTLENDHLVVTDSAGSQVRVAVSEIAKNTSFVTELASNNEFATQLGDNTTFIEQVTSNSAFIQNLISELEGTYGTVNYDVEQQVFYYMEGNTRRDIALEDLNTENQSFTLENDHLVITDSAGSQVRVAVSEIAKNTSFVTELASNNEFVTQLGDNTTFIEQVTSNTAFIQNLISELEGTYGTVNYDVEQQVFYYMEGNTRRDIALEDLNTENQSFTLENDHLVITDSEGSQVRVAVSEIAKNTSFVTELASNNEFATQLGDNTTFIEQVTSNSAFIQNLISELEGTYGTVNYDVEQQVFYYMEGNTRRDIALEDLNTENQSFTLENDHLVITDSEGSQVRVAVSEIAKNTSFVTELASNNEFATQLGDNTTFIEQVTSNTAFIQNLISELEGTYGTVNYDVEQQVFYYMEGNTRRDIALEDLNTENQSFTLENDHLVITDSAGSQVRVAVSEIAKNTSFVTELASNNEFATQLGDNTTFIEQVTSNTAFIQNLISELEGTYGTVNYDVEQQVFYYMEGNTRRDIALEDLNTENQSFTLENDHLVITDSAGSQVRVAVSEIAKNTSFVTELASNNEFATKLGDNDNFQKIVNANSVVAELKVSETVENSETVKGRFQFTNGKSDTIVHFSETLTAMEKGVDESGKTEYYFIDETGERDPIIVKVTQDIITDFNKIMADEGVKELMIDLIQANAGKGDASVHKNEEGDILITNAQASYNLSKEISNKETNTSLTLLGKGVYVYKNEEAIKTEGEGVTINVIEDVQNNFQEIMNNADVKTILNEFLTQGLAGNVTYKNGDFYVTYEKDQAFVTEKLELKSWIEKEASALTTDGVIAVEVDGVVGEAAEKAVLKAMKLSINEDAITTEHIKDGTIQPMDLAEAGKNQVLITGADQKPIWKDQNKVAPQFFYMPAVIFDTSIAGTTTRDLYQEYVNQFTGGSKNSENPVAYPISHGPAGTTPLLYGGGIVGSAGAPADIAVFESHELYYYVTYYDESVFENLSISADGKLTYTVKGGATPSSYMNIVFVIK